MLELKPCTCPITGPHDPRNTECYRNRENFARFQRERIAEALKHDAEQAKPKLAAGVKGDAPGTLPDCNCNIKTPRLSYHEPQCKYHPHTAPPDARAMSEYRDDYPSEPIGDGNPYYRCSVCGRSAPEINGRLEGHSSWCSWRQEQERAAGVMGVPK